MPKNITAYGQISASSIALTSTTQSTSSTTGALVVPGGIGIGGNLHVDGTITGGSVVYGSTSSGTFSVTDVSGTTLTVASTTESTSVGSGSATFAGGVSIAGNLYVGGTVVAGSITYASTSTGTLTVTTTPGTTVQVDSVEDSTTRANGSAKFAGGIGVQKRANVGSVRAFDTTQSTSITTGSGIFDGGIGAAGNIYAGGTVYSAGLIATGAINSLGSTISGGFDFIFGNTDQVTRGDTGQSRALVKLNSAILAINYAGDFTGGVAIQGLTNSTSSTSGAFRVQGGGSVELNFYVGGQLHSNTSVNAPTTNTALLNVTGTTDSTSIGTGTIINPGGLSNAKNITTLTLRTVGTTNSTSTTTGSIILSNGGGIGCAGNIYVGGILNSATITTGAITNTTITASGNISGSTITGSTLVSTGDVNVTGTTTTTTLSVTGTGTIATLNGTGTNTLNTIVGTSTTESTAIGVGGTQLAGGLSVAKNYSGASAHLYATGDSANKGDGVLIVDGGMGVNLKINAGSLRIWDTTDTTSPTTGAAVIDGGLGVAKNINCDGTIRNGGFDFILGNASNARGDSGQSRAIIKDFGNELVFNFLGEFDGGSRMDSKLRITNTNEAAADLTSSIYTLGGIRSAKNIWCGGFEFILGNENQVDRGNSGSSRALVKNPGATLILNYAEDFTGGVVVQGLTNSSSATTGAFRINGGGSVEKNWYVGQDLNVGGNLYVAGSNIVGNSTFQDLVVEDTLRIRGNLHDWYFAGDSFRGPTRYYSEATSVDYTTLYYTTKTNAGLIFTDVKCENTMTMTILRGEIELNYNSPNDRNEFTLVIGGLNLDFDYLAPGTYEHRYSTSPSNLFTESGWVYLAYISGFIHLRFRKSNGVFNSWTLPSDDLSLPHPTNISYFSFTLLGKTLPLDPPGFPPSL